MKTDQPEVKINALYLFEYDSGKKEHFKCIKIGESGVCLFRVTNSKGVEKEPIGHGLNREHWGRLLYRNKHKLKFIKQL